MKSKTDNEFMSALDNVQETSFDLPNWTVNGHIATHTSGITVTATESATDSANIACKLDLSSQHNFDEEVDVGQLTVDAVLMALGGKLLEAPPKKEPGVYEIPKEIRNQYRGLGLAFAAVKANKLRKIVYLRDVMSEESHNELVDGGYFKFTRWLQTPEAKRLGQADNLLGEIMFGICANLEFTYIAPRELTTELDDDGLF